MFHFYTPWKHQKSSRLSNIFKGYRNGTLAWNGLIIGVFFSRIFASSPPEVFLKKGVLKICSKFTAEHSCWSVISIKLLSSFIKISLRHWCSPVNLKHIFRTLFPRNTSGGHLLNITVQWNIYLVVLHSV